MGKNNKGQNKGRTQNYRLDHYPMNNEKLFKFYKEQPIIPTEEYDGFIEALKKPLPASFRIQLSLAECQLVDDHLHKKFFEKISQIEDVDVKPPEKLTFVPYGYQTDASRAILRSHLILKDLQQFLVNETEIGAISRQEAVSMIPPLLLDVKPEHFVLDMCAAPGSKTMQLIEFMHLNEPNPKGMIIANDIDYSRCYLLVHQTLKRLPISNCVVVSQDASQFPSVVDENEKPVLFDRILCDVICTGDGTFRKNIELWKTWDPQKALGLHKMQIQIAKRGLEMLKPGGKLVYSTCSLNPMEDEAVLAYLLRHFKGKVELVDVSKELPGLKRINGISSWKVFDRNMVEYENYSSVPPELKKSIVETMFPPTKEESEKFHLERSFRILPHHQNTGGFFVAVFKKNESFMTDERIWRPAPLGAPQKKMRRRIVREDPFKFLEASEYEDIKNDLTEHYGMKEDFPYDQLLIRSKEAENKKVVYYVSETVKKFMKLNENRFKIVNAGIGFLRRVEKVSVSKYRLMQDGMSVVSPNISKRIVHLNPDDAAIILQGTNDNHYCNLEDLKNSEEFIKLGSGSVVVRIDDGKFKKDFCVWMGAKTATAFISREEKIHCLLMMGKDASKLQVLTQSVRQKKANGGRQIAANGDTGEKQDVSVKIEDENDVVTEPEAKKPHVEDESTD